MEKEKLPRDCIAQMMMPRARGSASFRRSLIPRSYISWAVEAVSL